MKTENSSHAGCLQRDNVEREGYAGALSAIAQEAEETEGALLARILDRDNLNRAYKRVKVNKRGSRHRREEYRRNLCMAEGTWERTGRADTGGKI